MARRLSIIALVASVAFGILSVPPAGAQTPSATGPQFDVASVKLFKPGSAPENSTITAAHGSLRMPQQTLRQAIAWAYNRDDMGEIKGPEWIDSEQYDISAKAAESTTQDQLRLMLQSLLGERCKLVLHQRTEQRAVYLLVVGKGGPKLQEVRREPVKPFKMGFEGGYMSIHMVNHLSRLIGILPIFLDHPVLDGTGLTGVYELDLKVELNDAQARLPQAGLAFSGFGMTPGVFTAVEQLGLKLVPQKGPVEVLAIDHIERPGAN